MRRIAILAAFAAGLLARADAGEAEYYKPGRWVAVPAPFPRVLAAPGATTVVGAERADAQYVLPMSAPWTPADGAGAELAAVLEGGWLVAELRRGAGGGIVSHDGMLKALPPRSVIVELGDIRHGVAESVDLVVCREFSEATLQPQEQGALRKFARRGGAVLFLCASRLMPAAATPLWRDLFGAHGKPESQAPGLPANLLVPVGFRARTDIPAGRAEPPFVWKSCGRGIVLACRLPMAWTKPPEPGQPDKSAERSAKLFRRVVADIEAIRRPLTLGPVEPDAFGLFGNAAWSTESRRRLAWLGAGYATAAAGLLLSFGSLLARRRAGWLAGLALIAAGGIGILFADARDDWGLALETAAVVVVEPDADPVEAVIGRISRLGPGRAPLLRSAGPMPPRLLLYSGYSASIRSWLTYRFLPDGAVVEPTLDVGQSLCLASVRPLSPARARDALSAPDAPPPANADALLRFFRKHCAGDGRTYTFRWVRPRTPPALFAAASESEFTQVRHGPILVAQAAP